MSKFKLPPISPLIGTNLLVFFNVLRGRKIDNKNYLKVLLTFLILLVATLFHWLDFIYFKFKLPTYRFMKPPVFIIGHWRSGTTLLHNLLCRDPETGYVTTYHAVFPNNLKSKWLFKTFMKIFMPEERPGDQLKLSANFPQEDEYALSNLTHMSYYHSFYFPGNCLRYYNDYVRFQSVPAHKINHWKSVYKHMVSKAMINTKGDRAILKNPANTGRIDKLLEIWPDAKFVFLIRNPIIVYLSSKKFFTQLYPTVELKTIPKSEIQETILEIYSKLLKDYLELKKLIPPEQLLEIRYEDLKRQPEQTLELIYTKFRLNDFNKVRPVFDRYLSTQKDHKVHRYSIEKAELEFITGKLKFAMDHWKYTMPGNLDVYDKTPTDGKKTVNYAK